MGQAAQARAREVFDWRVVIPQYQALWEELRRRRQAAPAQPGLENPYRPDPFRMFAGYPTHALAADDKVMLARAFAPGEAAELLQRPFVRADAARLPSLAEAEALLALLAAGPRTVGALVAQISPERRPFVERGIVWLAKFGIVRLRDGTSRT
jgi:glycosyltransferase involved in cell wall biosynthesis